MGLVSIIMPTLNVAAFIGKCLESVVRQTFQDFEVLAVDAGSVDGTREIVERFAAEDKRIKLIHSDVKSYGYQMNKGIALAHGKYLAVVEPDDYIAESMLEDLHARMELYGLDYVKADYYSFWNFQSGDIYQDRQRAVPGSLYNIILNPSEHREIHMSDIYLWNGIYDISFLRKHNIRFNESAGAAYQDVGFLFQTLGYAERVMYLDEAYYHYRRDNASSSTYNPKGFQYIVGEYAYIYGLLHDTCIWEGIAHPFYARLFAQCRYRIQTMAAGGKKWPGMEENIYAIRDRLQAGMEDGSVDKFALDMDTWLELNMFIKDADRYVDVCVDRYACKRALFGAFYDRIKRYDAVVFYSCSKMGKYVCSLLEAKGIDKEIVFCDNDLGKQGGRFAGRPVYSCEEAVERYPGAFYIIANYRYSDDMPRQLLGLGVNKGDIFRYKWDCEPLNRFL